MERTRKCDGRTDGQTDGRTDGQSGDYMPPKKFSGSIKTLIVAKLSTSEKMDLFTK